MLSKIPVSRLHVRSLGEEDENAVYPYGIFSSFKWDALYRLYMCFGGGG